MAISLSFSQSTDCLRDSLTSILTFSLLLVVGHVFTFLDTCTARAVGVLAVDLNDQTQSAFSQIGSQGNIYSDISPFLVCSPCALVGGNPAEGQRAQVPVVLFLHTSLLGREEDGEGLEQLWRDKRKICSTSPCFLGKHTASQGLTPGNGYRANLICTQICTSVCSCVHVHVYMLWLSTCKSFLSVL